MNVLAERIRLSPRVRRLSGHVVSWAIMQRYGRHIHPDDAVQLAESGDCGGALQEFGRQLSMKYAVRGIPIKPEVENKIAILNAALGKTSTRSERQQQTEHILRQQGTNIGEVAAGEAVTHRLEALIVELENRGKQERILLRGMDDVVRAGKERMRTLLGDDTAVGRYELELDDLHARFVQLALLAGVPTQQTDFALERIVTSGRPRRIPLWVWVGVLLLGVVILLTILST